MRDGAVILGGKLALCLALCACGASSVEPSPADAEVADADGGLDGLVPPDADVTVDDEASELELPDLSDAVELPDLAPDADADVEVGPDLPADESVGPDPCEAIAGASFASLSIVGSPTDRPAAEHGDINLALRGWSPTGGSLELVDYGGDTDVLAPKLRTLFAADRPIALSANARVNHWDWGCNCRGAAIESPEVTLTAMATSPAEIVELPDSGYDLGEGYEAMVLFVDDDSITLKYTREDNVVWGYTVHLEGVCVDPALRARYEADNANGRGQLPVLRGNQAFARARTERLWVAIRDTGSFMDPRSRKDWW